MLLLIIRSIIFLMIYVKSKKAIQYLRLCFGDLARRKRETIQRRLKMASFCSAPARSSQLIQRCHRPTTRVEIPSIATALKLSQTISDSRCLFSASIRLSCVLWCYPCPPSFQYLFIPVGFTCLSRKSLSLVINGGERESGCVLLCFNFHGIGVFLTVAGLYSTE